MAKPSPRPCAHCGEHFTPKAHHYAACCSVKCSKLRWHHSTKSMADRPPKPCLVCGVEMPAGTFPTKGYCSRRCGNVAKTLRVYGLTIADYRRMMDEQGHLCAICGRDDVWKPDDPRGGWHIDHDHATGKVRGVLCPACNLMLGYARDTPDILTNAARYLLRG